MSDQTIKLRREELYEKVWTTPIRKLAPEFGLSDVGLAKICKKHQIPRPGLGYWRRVELGQKPPRTPLPPVNEPHLEVIEITVHAKPPNWKRRVSELKLAEGFQPPIVTVRPDQPISHPLAIRTQKLLAHTQESESGRVYPKSGVARHLSVTEGSLPRALRILDALFHAFEGQGYTVKWPKEEASRLTIIAVDQEMLFSIREIVKTKPHTPTEQELARQKRGQWVSMPSWDYEPTGRLEVKVESTYWSWSQHKRTDSKTHRLEDCLGDFVLGVRFLAEQTKRLKEEHERERRERAEQEKRREAESQRREDLARNVQAIRKIAIEWHEDKLVRGFVQAFDEASQQFKLNEAARREVQTLLDWSKRYAESITLEARVARILNVFRGNPHWIESEPKTEEPQPDPPAASDQGTP